MVTNKKLEVHLDPSVKHTNIKSQEAVDATSLDIGDGEFTLSLDYDQL